MKSKLIMKNEIPKAYPKLMYFVGDNGNVKHTSPDTSFVVMFTGPKEGIVVFISSKDYFDGRELAVYSDLWIPESFSDLCGSVTLET